MIIHPTWIVSRVFIVLSVCLSDVLTTECPLDWCNTMERQAQSIITFIQHGEPVPAESQVLLVSSQNASKACLLSTDDIINTFRDLPKTDTVGTLVIFCPKPLEIQFSPYNGSLLHNIIGYLQIENCVMNLENVNEISKHVDMRVVSLNRWHTGNGTHNCKNETDEVECSGLASTVALSISPAPESTKPDIHDILACQDVFPSMTEVVFLNLSWSTVPDVLKIKFPNLQTLEIPYNKLTVPPSFPWTDTEVKLPRNLSRTDYFQSHYSNVFHMTIDPNIYRRLLNLDHNKISNLTDYQFKGNLHMLTIDSNGLQEIGSLSFKNLQGLQHLSLSENKLQKLPVDVFKTLQTLHHLDLSKNNLSHLLTGTFDDLSTLRYLNLANNSINLLSTYLFSKLLQLEELRVEMNQMTLIPAVSFPLPSVRLQNVYLNNNPIVEFPEVLFYIRNLKMADLQNTSISLNLSKLVRNTDDQLLANSVIESASDSTFDLKKTPNRLRVINLSGSKIKSFELNDSLTRTDTVKLLLILKNFKLILINNPISCDCEINNFKTLVSNFQSNGTLTGKEYFFKDWKCAAPSNFASKSLFSIAGNDTYCKTDTEFCPEGCVCSKRYKQKITIVDCRWRNLVTLPHRLPRGIIDLWFQNNNITTLEYRPYLHRVRQLLLSKNSLTKIHKKALLKMNRLRKLHLDSNLLQNIDKCITQLRLRDVWLHNNPFECDCHAIWMKNWVLKNLRIVRHSNEISCSSEKDEGQKLIVTPDDEFICKEQFDTIKHVVIPTLSTTLISAILIISTGILIAYRLEVKVLLYIHFGIHPFDKDEDGKEEEYDAAIVHAPSLTPWVMDNIVAILEKEGHSYIVCEMMRDFIAGFTYHENISNVVRRSKRMLLILSPSLALDNELFRMSWNEAKNKIKQVRTNYAILICHEISPKSVQTKDLKNFAKYQRCITSKDRLFKEKILYLMPVIKSRTYTNNLNPMSQEINLSSVTLDTISVHTLQNEIPIFLTYAEKDIHYVIKSLVPKLERLGYTLILPDRDFILGASKEENILHAIDSCAHTLFILSGDRLQDEWLLFTFRCASEKSLRDKSNNLIVILLEDVQLDSMDEEIQYYIRTHVTLKISNPWFWRRVQNALSRNTLENRTVVINNDTDSVGSGPVLSNVYNNDNPMNSGMMQQPTNSETNDLNSINVVESGKDTSCISFGEKTQNLKREEKNDLDKGGVTSCFYENKYYDEPHNYISDTCNTCVIDSQNVLNIQALNQCHTCVYHEMVDTNSFTNSAFNINETITDLNSTSLTTCSTCVHNRVNDANLTPDKHNCCKDSNLSSYVYNISAAEEKVSNTNNEDDKNTWASTHL